MPSRLRNITRYVQALAVPAQRHANDVEARPGERLFMESQCGRCHVPELRTGRAQIASVSNLVMRPYIDLSLHEMGAELSDCQPDFLANERQWRRLPLWALGLQKTVNGHTDLFHDARVRNFEEVIAWHGGETQKSRERFLNMDRRERAALVRFLEPI